MKRKQAARTIFYWIFLGYTSPPEADEPLAQYTVFSHSQQLVKYRLSKRVNHDRSGDFPMSHI
jgi:hypothetical protein